VYILGRKGGKYGKKTGRNTTFTLPQPCLSPGRLSALTALPAFVFL